MNGDPDSPDKCIRFSYFHDRGGVYGPKDLLDGGNGDAVLLRVIVTIAYEIKERLRVLEDGWRVHIFSTSDPNGLMANHACALAAFIAKACGATEHQYDKIPRIASDRNITETSPQDKELLDKIRSALHAICLPIVGLMELERIPSSPSSESFRGRIVVQRTSTLADFVNGKIRLIDLDFLRNEILGELQRTGLDIKELTITHSR